jgi:hypothetical protein
MFRISTEALDRACKHSPDLKMAIENAIGQDTRTKLIAINARVKNASV